MSFFSVTLISILRLNENHQLTQYFNKNKTVGAISGSLTPYVGWAAAGGSVLDPIPFFLTSFIFCWQYSHFYGILWMYKIDYQKAGFYSLI